MILSPATVVVGPTVVVGATVVAGAAVVVGAAVVGGGELAVQPESLADAAVADPSFTSTVQSAGAANPSRSILKFPDPSLVPIATPSTVIVQLAVRPSEWFASTSRLNAHRSG